MTKNGVSLLIDAMSYQYLIGAEIDYKEDLQGAQFVIKNPNAQTTLRLRLELLGVTAPIASVSPFPKAAACQRLFCDQIGLKRRLDKR